MVEQAVITEDEAALYDRQIRLWGLDAQRRYFVFSLIRGRSKSNDLIDDTTVGRTAGTSHTVETLW